MEKYLVIIIMIVIAYYLHKCWMQNQFEKFMEIKKIREDFGDAVTVDGVDDNNAINTLAKIAKDLQEGGGLKVKGNLIVDNTIRVTGAKTTPAGSGDMMTHFNHQDGNNYIRGNTYLSGNFNTKEWITTSGLASNGDWPIVAGPEKNRFVFHTPNDDRKGIWIVPAKDDTASAWLWDVGLNLRRNGEHELGGRLKISGRDILAEIDNLKNSVGDLNNKTIKNQERIIIRGRKGALENYAERCNRGDGDRDIGVACGHGVDFGDGLLWRIDKA